MQFALTLIRRRIFYLYLNNMSKDLLVIMVEIGEKLRSLYRKFSRAARGWFIKNKIYQCFVYFLPLKGCMKKSRYYSFVVIFGGLFKKYYCFCAWTVFLESGSIAKAENYVMLQAVVLNHR